MAKHFRSLLLVLLIGTLAYLSSSVRGSAAQGTPPGPATDFDAETQALIDHADRVVFLIPFSHWDTDWHQPFSDYSRFADQNILAAIQIAKQYPRFRYTLEQVLFVQHFWDNHPESRADLKALVQNHQISFAWGAITQPETSLAAPAIQVRDLQLGEAWIADTFGPEYVPHSAWQSDAFGTSAAFPSFLSESNVSYLFVGRGKARCDPAYQTCQPLPPAFFWTSPATPAGIAGRVLTAYISYPEAWDDIYHRTDPDAQLRELRNTTDAEFKQTTSKYLFLPVGFDFADPKDNLPALVDRWNAADQKTVLVESSAESAFRYLATQPLPELTTDLNPLWQGFYGTRPAAKIADKESEYYLTAADKFGMMLDAPQSSAWNLAAMNAHYDNVAGVSFDSVWNSSQYPRFQQTLSTAQNDLAAILSSIATRVPAPVTVFNPTSWSRSEVVELEGNLPDVSILPQPVQKINASDVAFLAQNVPPLGYAGLKDVVVTIDHPASANKNENTVTLANGLVSVTIDGDHGGTFSSLVLADQGIGSHELLSTFGDDVTYLDDKGDVYGASFGQEHARESKVSAQVTVLAAGPLLSRVQASFTLGGQSVTKTITIRADDPLVEVALDISALPETTALVNTPTTLNTDTRTDDLGFGAFTHGVDTRPIVPGDVTYRRSIFYPVTYWSDVSTVDTGLTIITHGLQGMAGTTTRSFMLIRQVTHDPEGVTDPGVHHLLYAYFPHTGSAADTKPWLAAYAFNQPLIAAWTAGNQLTVQLPFDTATSPRQFDTATSESALPLSASLLSAQNAIVSDVYRQGDQVELVALNYDPNSPANVQIGSQQILLSQRIFTVIPVASSLLKSLPVK